MILMKIAARTDHSLTITVMIGMLSSPLSLLGAIPVWQWPTWGEFGLLVLIGSLAGLGMICVAQAFRDADMTAVLPFDFMKLVWASTIGYVFFAETPHVLTWVGGVVIFVAAAYVTLQERRGSS
jgi:drug/metabolite transporter (DMT)-like permease